MFKKLKNSFLGICLSMMSSFFAYGLEKQEVIDAFFKSISECAADDVKLLIDYWPEILYSTNEMGENGLIYAFREFRHIDICNLLIDKAIEHGLDVKRIIRESWAMHTGFHLSHYIVESAGLYVISYNIENREPAVRYQIHQTGDQELISLSRKDLSRALASLFYRFFVRCVEIEPLIARYTISVTNETCLHVAAREGSFEIFAFILSLSVNPNAQNLYGLTPLHIIMEENRPIEFTRMLLEHGALTFVADKRGLDVFQSARKRKLQSHLSIMRQYSSEQTHAIVPAYLRVLQKLHSN